MLEFITSDALTGVAHGFFTRNGGVSTGIYAGLNCGAGSDDVSQNVQKNRDLVANEIGVPAENLASVHQVHSPSVLTVDHPVPAHNKPKVDAMVTATPGIALGILTADCQPVLFADRAAGVVGAAHAGWRGALDGVLDATVDAMCDLGARRETIVSVIGPCISQRAYEVGPEFLDTFLSEDPEFARYFANGKGDRLQFDLPGFGLNQLRKTGISLAEWTGHCTYSDPSRFYSYRMSTHHSEPDYGRLISVIRL